MMTSLLKMAGSVGAAVLSFFVIFVAATFLYGLLNLLGRSRRLRPILIGVTFLVVGIGAYAASFVTDNISEACFGQLPPAKIARPCVSWSLISLCSLAICARRPVPFLVRAAPFWLFGLIALVASVARPRNLITAIPLILVGVAYGLFYRRLGSAKTSNSNGGEEDPFAIEGRLAVRGDAVDDRQAANLTAAEAALTGRPMSEVAAAAAVSFHISEARAEPLTAGDGITKIQGNHGSIKAETSR